MVSYLEGWAEKQEKLAAEENPGWSAHLDLRIQRTWKDSKSYLPMVLTRYVDKEK